MKKYIACLSLLILILSLPVGAAPSTAPTPDFRQASWGMTLDQVKTLEKKECLSASNDYLVYKDQVGGYNVFVYYGFSQKFLTHGYYLFDLTLSSASDYLSTFNTLRNTLSLKYSDPVSEGFTLYDNAPIHYQSSPVNAVNLGYGFYYAVWKSNTSIIELNFRKEEGTLKLTLAYVSFQYFDEFVKSQTSGF